MFQSPWPSQKLNKAIAIGKWYEICATCTKILHRCICIIQSSHFKSHTSIYILPPSTKTYSNLQSKVPDLMCQSVGFAICMRFQDRCSCCQLPCHWWHSWWPKVRWPLEQTNTTTTQRQVALKKIPMVGRSETGSKLLQRTIKAFKFESASTTLVTQTKIFGRILENKQLLGGGTKKTHLHWPVSKSSNDWSTAMLPASPMRCVWNPALHQQCLPAKCFQ